MDFKLKTIWERSQMKQVWMGSLLKLEWSCKDLGTQYELDHIGLFRLGSGKINSNGTRCTT